MALQERANSTTMQTEATSPYESNVKGDELPIPTIVTAHNVITSQSSGDQRRIQRYSTAEEDLARQFEKCLSETSSVDLQIRTLKKVTTILSTHAQDARERTEKLRGLLADRDMDPETYESLQRERWIQEHRQDAFVEEAKVVQQQLTNLSNGLTHGNVSQSKRTEDEERRRRNLIRFLDDSNKRPSVHIRKSTSVLMERPPKRRTMDRVSPMSLRTTSVVSRPSFQPLRPMSLDGWTRRSRRTSTLVGAPPILIPPVSLHLVSEDELDEVVSSPSETASSLPSIFTTTSYSSPPSSTATTLTISRSTSAETKAEDENGTATILLDTHLSKAHYNPRDIDASLPDYALDLFARFDYDIDITFSNTPGCDLDAGLRQVRSQKSAPLPPSSYLQVPSSSPSKRPERKSSRLRRPSSYRQLGALFSIPEAVSSRIGFNTGDKRAHNREAVLSKSTSNPSLAPSSAVVEEVKTDKITTKIKKRFSMLRLRRS